jgi:RHS repeat-associated protein
VPGARLTMLCSKSASPEQGPTHRHKPRGVTVGQHSRSPLGAPPACTDYVNTRSPTAPHPLPLSPAHLRGLSSCMSRAYDVSDGSACSYENTLKRPWLGLLSRRSWVGCAACPEAAGRVPKGCNAVGGHNPYTFTARRLDQESGLLQYRFREYDPGLGRVVSRDSIGYGGGAGGLLRRAPRPGVQLRGGDTLAARPWHARDSDHPASSW